MISPQEQQLLRPPKEDKSRFSPFLTPLFIALACILLPLVLPYAMTTTNELQVIGLVLGLVAVGVVIGNPFWGLMIFIGLIYVRPEDYMPELASLRLTLLVSCVTLIGTLCQRGIDRQRIVRDPVNPLIIAFGVIMVLSTLMSAGGETLKAAEDVAKLVLLVLLVINLARTPDKCRTFISALILFTLYLSAHGIYLYMTGQALHVAEEGVDRAQATGIFGDPNDLAATLAAGLALTIGRVVSSRGGGKFCYGLIAAFIVFAIITTNSRGGLLALIAVLSGAFIVFGRRKSLAVAIAVIVAAATFMLAPTRMSNYDSEEESANARFNYWDNGFGMFAQNPILGVGYQQFEDGNNGATAHNSFVLCFTELGFPGYFAWMGCLYYCFRRKPIRGESDSERKELTVVRLALAGFLVAAFWISRTYIAILYIYIGLACAVYLSARAKAEAEGRQPVEERYPFHNDWLRILGLCVGMMLLIKLMVEHYT